MSIGGKTLRGAGYMLAAGNLTIVVSFTGNLLLARILLPDDFGIYALAGSILSLIFMLGGFGSQEAIIQNRDITPTNFIPTAFWISFAIAFSLALLGSAIGLVLAGVYDSPVPQFIIVLAWMHFFTAVGSTYSTIMKRRIDFKGISILQLGKVLLSFIVAIIAALIGFGAWALIVREIVLAVISVVGFILLSRYAVALTFDWKSARTIWSFGWKLMISRTTEVIFGRFDNFVVGSVLGTATLGHYSMAYRLSFLGHQFTQSAIQPVVFSAFSTMQHSPKQLQYAFDRLMYWLIRASVLLGLGVMILGKELVELLYGDNWTLAGAIFQNMWLFLAILPIHEAVRHVLIGVGYVNQVVVSRIIMLAFFVSALAMTVAIGDIILVAWSVNLSLVISTGLMLYHVRGKVTVKWIALFRNPVIAAFSTTLLVLFTRQHLLTSASTYLYTLVSGFQVIILYCIIILALEFFTLRVELGIIRSRLSDG